MRLLVVGNTDMRDRIRRAISSQKRPTVTVLSSLLAAQDALGYISDEAVEEIATFKSTTINEVWVGASFYLNFRFKPPGDHTVEVCWGPPCHLAGAPDILSSVQEQLGLSDEGETEDNRVTLKYNTCLGACQQAPVISLDHRLVGRLNPDSARALVAALAEGDAATT